MSALAGEGPWQDRLRTRGYRLTPQRELVLAAVDRLGHGSPEEVHAAVGEQTAAISLSTVYRTLSLLERLGLVRLVYLTDRTPIYHTMADAHVHLSCSSCGAVSDAEPEEFAALAVALARRHGFAVDLDRLVVPGRCAACAPAE